MKGRISLLVGGAVGYVLGTRAGRQRYEQIVSQAQQFWNNPKVQEQAEKAQGYAKEKAPLIKDKAAGAATSATTAAKGAGSAAKDKVGGTSKDDTAAYPNSASASASTSGIS